MQITPKALRLLGFLKRSCYNELSAETFRRLFVMLVRPHVDYASTIWNPQHITLITKIERVQRRFVRYACLKTKIPYDGDNYNTLCRRFHILTLEDRRTVTDLLFLYKIINNFLDSDLLQFINFRVPICNLRNRETFLPTRSRIDVFKYSTLNRLQFTYNHLSLRGEIDVFDNTIRNFKASILKVFN